MILLKVLEGQCEQISHKSPHLLISNTRKMMGMVFRWNTQASSIMVRHARHQIYPSQHHHSRSFRNWTFHNKAPVSYHCYEINSRTLDVDWSQLTQGLGSCADFLTVHSQATEMPGDSLLSLIVMQQDTCLHKGSWD